MSAAKGKILFEGEKKKFLQFQGLAKRWLNSAARLHVRSGVRNFFVLVNKRIHSVSAVAVLYTGGVAR